MPVLTRASVYALDQETPEICESAQIQREKYKRKGNRQDNRGVDREIEDVVLFRLLGELEATAEREPKNARYQSGDDEGENCACHGPRPYRLVELVKV